VNNTSANQNTTVEGSYSTIKRVVSSEPKSSDNIQKSIINTKIISDINMDKALHKDDPIKPLVQFLTH
jgi:hypothetical protein